MKNVLKIMLVLAMCLSLVMMVACSKEDAKKTDKGGQTAPSGETGKVESNDDGMEDTDVAADPEENLEGEVTVTENPEGDPGLTENEKTESNTSSNEGGEEVPNETEEEEPAIEVEAPIEEGGKETEPDMEVDFGDLLG